MSIQFSTIKQRNNCTMQKVRSLQYIPAKPDSPMHYLIPRPIKSLCRQYSLSSFKNMSLHQNQTVENKAPAQSQIANDRIVFNSSQFLNKNSQKNQHKIQSVQRKLQAISSKLDRFTLRVQCIQNNMKSNLSNFSDQIFKFLDDKYSAKAIDQKISDRIKMLKLEIEDVKSQLCNTSTGFDYKLFQDQEFLNKIRKIQNQTSAQFYQKVENLSRSNQIVEERIQKLQLKKLGVTCFRKPTSAVETFSCKSDISSLEDHKESNIYYSKQNSLQIQKRKLDKLAFRLKIHDANKQAFQSKKNSESSYDQSDSTKGQLTIFVNEPCKKDFQRGRQLNTVTSLNQSQANNIVYYLDEDKCLMDANGYYIQDQYGNAIVLSSAQEKELERLLILGQDR